MCVVRKSVVRRGFGGRKEEKGGEEEEEEGEERRGPALRVWANHFEEDCPYQTGSSTARWRRLKRGTKGGGESGRREKTKASKDLDDQFCCDSGEPRSERLDRVLGFKRARVFLFKEGDGEKKRSSIC